MVTDGEDDASQETLEQAVHKLQQENGPVVYAIGLLGEEKSRRAKRALEVIAERTGGIAFFPPTLDQVDEISRVDCSRHSQPVHHHLCPFHAEIGGWLSHHPRRCGREAL